MEGGGAPLGHPGATAAALSPFAAGYVAKKAADAITKSGANKVAQSLLNRSLAGQAYLGAVPPPLGVPSPWWATPGATQPANQPQQPATAP